MNYFKTILLLFYWPVLCLAQPVVEDFEQNNLDNWTLITGNADIDGTIAYADQFSARLHKPDQADAASMIRHKTFDESWGIYHVKCYADGGISDVRFRFQYQNENNYYEVSANPRGTDNPGLILYKMVNGNFELLDSVVPIFDLHQWFQIIVERTCAGELFVSIDDVLQISVIDQGLRQSASIGIGAWGESSYFDDLTFEARGGNIIVDIDTVICSGAFFEVGNSRYNQTGMYQDTIVTDMGCDSLVRLNLTVSNHYLVTDFDTICAGDFYLFGNDTLRRTGRYGQSLKSQHGCDSVVELILWVLGGDTIRLDSTICNDDFFVFGADTLRLPGFYYDTLYAPDGCYGIIELFLDVIDAVFTLGDDQSLCFDQGDRLTLSSSGVDEVLWSNGTVSPNLPIDSAGTYWAEVRIGSCLLRDSITFFNSCTEAPKIFFPSGFSPNRDQTNDVFLPEFGVPPNSFEMQIFNRNGSLVHASTNLGGWDGTIDGIDAPIGVYVFVCKIDGNIHRGDVTLIR